MRSRDGPAEKRPGDTFAGFLTGDTERDRKKVDILLDTIAEVNSTRDLDDLLTSVVDKSIAFTRAQRGILMLFDSRKRLLVRVARDALEKDLPDDVVFSHTIPHRVLDEGNAICMTDIGREPPVSLTASIESLGLLTVMCAPLRVKGRTIGVLYVDSGSNTREFTPGDFSLFKALSYQLAIAIENARLSRKEQGLSVARDIQRRLLPRGGLPLPGFDIHGVSHPCDEAGGDYFDFLRISPGHVGLVVGDVSGHGVGAALLMATGRGLLRAYASTERDPARVVDNLNNALEQDMSAETFMTLFLGDLDVAERTLRFVKAGHCEPLLLRGDTGRFETLSATGMALGIVRDYRYVAAGPYLIRPGDTLAIYTDGIPEARNAAGELFGMDRFRALLAADIGSAREIAKTVVAEVKAFAKAGGLEDDVTLIVVRGV